MTINNNAGIKAKYERELIKLVDKMSFSTEKEINALFRSKTAYDYFKFSEDEKKDKNLSFKAKLALSALLIKFRSLFSKASRRTALAFLENVNSYTSSAVKRELKVITGKELKIGSVATTTAQALINENVSLIKSIPEQYFTQITGEVMRAISTGQRHDLEDAIAKHGKVTLRRARVIASDQTHKAIQTIAMQKMIDQGFKKFRWVYTFRSKEPRKSHVAMNGNIYSFDDLPVVNADYPKQEVRHGLPGSEVNCKCVIGVVSDWEK